MTSVNPAFPATASSEDHDGQLEQAIGRAASLLPAQGPLAIFAYLNRLQSLEDLDFEEAVVLGAKLYGSQPYWPEADYHREIERGRILPVDLREELIDDLGDAADGFLGFLGTRYQLRLAMLEQPLRLTPTHELEWLITESDALREFRDEVTPAVRTRLIESTRTWVLHMATNGFMAGQSADGAEVIREILRQFDVTRAERWSDDTWASLVLHLLWRACLTGVHEGALPLAPPPPTLRLRDALLAVTGVDSDSLVHDLLARYAAAFCDQGLAAKPLPTRTAGFWAGFCKLYGMAGGSPEPWLRDLRPAIERISSAGMKPLEFIRQTLDDLGVAAHDREAYLTATLLALKGWAGMIRQMEIRGDRVPVPAPAGSLVEFLAVRLLLDKLALSHVARESLGWDKPLRQLGGFLSARLSSEPHLTTEQRAFQIFQLAQLRGWRPEVLCRLSADQWSSLVSEVEAFSNVERRRIFQRAYERRYRILALDALAAHRHRADDTADVTVNPPAFQIITCIDDREESFRRHIEEIEPVCATFGAAGFFAVAMYFRGVADAHDTPLCPIDVTPQHYVRERVALTFEDSERVRRKTRVAIGTVTHRFHVGSRTFIGGLVAAVFGSLASLPLVMRILFPRTTAHLRTWFGGFVAPPLITSLEIERTAATPGPTPGHVGYSVDEMAAIVGRLLRDIGLTNGLARLVVLLGHGSSSQNNPHESAYNCGACSGGRGGANARSFARMANDARVRARLAQQGLVIPESTWFLSGEHDTCDDGVSLHDLDHLPSTHASDFYRLRDTLNEARRRNAQERCRRFYSAALSITPEAALRHVQARSADLSQVRPEYKHPNALCLVGRREMSRGLFLDRRAFLQSYDPAQDDDHGTILTRILQAVVPVCAGINLEYFFSTIDPIGWGSGNKLSHNIASLVGVMDGAASDLRPGLTRQMIEIHEPMRLLFVIETTAAVMHEIMMANPRIAALVKGRWVQLAIMNPTSAALEIWHDGRFEPYAPGAIDLPNVDSSREWYRGQREAVGFARILPHQSCSGGSAA